MSPKRSPALPLICLAVYVAAALVAAIEPVAFGTWAMESSIPFVAVVVLVATWPKKPLSNRAYLQITAFALLHTVGSHYTYSLVPPGNWLRDTFEVGRNHYDRLVHFSFGALLFYPMREVLFRDDSKQKLRHQLLYTLGLMALIGVSYELAEWWIALVVTPDAGNAFLGSQGDVWDSHKDLLCNTSGGLVAAAVDLALKKWGKPVRSSAYLGYARVSYL